MVCLMKVCLIALCIHLLELCIVIYTTSYFLNVHAAELSEVVGSQNTEMLH